MEDVLLKNPIGVILLF